MSSEMIERVENELGKYLHGDDAAIEAAARAAITAMREPTSDMIGAVDADVIGYDRPPIVYWQAMIDQALVELSPLRPPGSADQFGVPRAEE